MLTTTATTAALAAVAVTASPAAAYTPPPFTSASWGGWCVNRPTTTTGDHWRLGIDGVELTPGTASARAGWRFAKPSTGRASFVLTDAKGKALGPSSSLTFKNVKRVEANSAPMTLPSAYTCANTRVRVTVAVKVGTKTHTHQTYVGSSTARQYITAKPAR